MKVIWLILISVLTTGCAVEFTDTAEDEKYLKILKESFPEFTSYDYEIKILNGKKVVYSVENVDEKLLNSITDSNKYGALRKSAKKMAQNITEVKNSEELIFEFATEITKRATVKQQLKFMTTDLLNDKTSSVSVAELRGMLGKSIRDKSVGDILNNHFGQPETVDKFSLNYYAHGVSVLYLDSTICSISLHLNDDSGFNQYSGKYPKNLNVFSNKHDVESAFGKPLVWKTHPNYFRYPKDSLIFHFQENFLHKIIIDESAQ